MFILSKIIAKEWFKSLLGAIVVLFILITVGDIVNGFLRGYEARRVLLEYILKMPELMSKLIPICSLLATLFSLNKLKGHSELVAILAGGYSAAKIYFLILCCSLSVATFQFINLGYIVPNANKIKRSQFEKSQRNESKYLARSRIGGAGLLWYKSSNYFTSFSAFDRINKELKNISIYFYNKEGKLESIYKSKTASYKKDNQWKLKEITIMTYLDGESFPQITKKHEILVNLKERPLDFGQFESDITTLNYFDLSRFISKLNNTGINSSEYKIMLYEKLSLSLICIIFALFPAAGVFSPNRRSSSFGKSVVFTLIFTIAFWGVYSAVIALGNSGKLPPLIATMGIPFIFVIYIVWTYQQQRKL